MPNLLSYHQKNFCSRNILKYLWKIIMDEFHDYRVAKLLKLYLIITWILIKLRISNWLAILPKVLIINIVLVCIVSFAGCIGSLRENLFFLKFYSFCLLIFFLLEMVLLALAFIYPHKLTGIKRDKTIEINQYFNNFISYVKIISLK